MNIKPSIIIFSVSQLSEPQWKNIDNHEATKRVLRDRGVDYIEAIGMYKGVKELSLIVLKQYESVVKQLVQVFKQESYLVSENDRSTSLVLSSGEVIFLGRLAPINAAESTNYDNLTYRPDINQYYTTIKE